MESKTLKRLPVGIQTFSEVIDRDCLYVDKTEYICRMTNFSKYIFLSRPRRFGKSLLVSTIQSYFEGRRELFKGLYIDSVEKEWTAYPVLKFSMAMTKLDLSARAYDRILKVARTIADYEGCADITSTHIAEAISYRNLDRNSWGQG